MIELLAVYVASIGLGIFLTAAAKRNHRDGLTHTKPRFRVAVTAVTETPAAEAREKGYPAVQQINAPRAA